MSQNRNGEESERMPETEVVEKEKRRQYTAEYKLCIYQEVEACKETGEIGTLLRRED